MVTRDVEALKNSGEFEDISADAQRNAAGVEVTFLVKRKMRFAGPLVVQGNEAFSESKVAKEAEGIDPALIEKYKSIKRHAAMPITRLHDDRCGGCNMQLSAADKDKVRSGQPYVECENCGRIILVK